MTVLAAVDDAARTAVIERGVEFARAFDEDLVVLHVASEREGREAAAAVAREAIRAALDDPDAARVTAVGTVGDPAAGIVRESAARDVRCIVLGPRKRTPLGKALMGSVSQLVLLNADRTVVFAAPDGS
jgi:nucleotide-binding universal stress UspA family protein